MRDSKGLWIQSKIKVAQRQRILPDIARCHRRRNQSREEEVITVNMIELWKVEHSNTYMNWVGLYGYERAQEMVLAAMESRPKKRK